LLLTLLGAASVAALTDMTAIEEDDALVAAMTAIEEEEAVMTAGNITNATKPTIKLSKPMAEFALSEKLKKKLKIPARPPNLCKAENFLLTAGGVDPKPKKKKSVKAPKKISAPVNATKSGTNSTKIKKASKKAVKKSATGKKKASKKAKAKKFRNTEGWRDDQDVSALYELGESRVEQLPSVEVLQAKLKSTEKKEEKLAKKDQASKAIVQQTKDRDKKNEKTVAKAKASLKKTVKLMKAAKAGNVTSLVHAPNTTGVDATDAISMYTEDRGCGRNQSAGMIKLFHTKFVKVGGMSYKTAMNETVSYTVSARLGKSLMSIKVIVCKNKKCSNIIQGADTTKATQRQGEAQLRYDTCYKKCDLPHLLVASRKYTKPNQRSVSKKHACKVFNCGHEKRFLRYHNKVIALRKRKASKGKIRKWQAKAIEASQAWEYKPHFCDTP